MVYLYCVTGVETGRIEALKGMPRDLRIIRHGGVSAVVGRAFRKDFGEEAIGKNLADMKWLESRVVLHERVVERAMSNGPVVPFKFATIFETEGKVRALLEERAGEYRALLEWLRGKQEWGVKVYCDTGEMKMTLRRKTPEIKHIDEEIMSSTAGKAYLLGKKAETAAESAFRKGMGSIIEDCKNRLEEQSADIKLNAVSPGGAAGRGAEMLLNAACLVETAGLGRFKNAAAGLAADYGGMGVEFIHTGPWPPYNFCACPGWKCG